MCHLSLSGIIRHKSMSEFSRLKSMSEFSRLKCKYLFPILSYFSLMREKLNGISLVFTLPELLLKYLMVNCHFRCNL